MMAVSERVVQQLEREYDPVLRELKVRANPLPFIEKFFKIVDVKSELVAFRLLENQRYYQERIFGRVGGYDRPLNFLLVKDRDAKASSYLAACEFAFFCARPGFQAAHGAHTEKAVKLLNTYFNTFKAALPEEVYFYLGMQFVKWDESRKEAAFYDQSGKEVVRSHLLLESSGSVDAFRGARPKMIVYDEEASYDPENAVAFIKAAEGGVAGIASTWKFHLSNPVGGKKTQFYKNFLAVQKGESNDELLVRYWFQNPEKRLAADSPLTLKSDVRLVMTDKERVLAKRFADDGVPPEDRIRWKRRQIYESLKSYDSQEQAEIAFLQEHPEDLETCWFDPKAMQFKLASINFLQNMVSEPVREETMRSGLRLSVWEEPSPDGLYVGGTDLGGGGAHADETVHWIMECRSNMYVARLGGRAHPGDSMADVISLMWEHYRGFWAWERTGAVAIEDIVLRILEARGIDPEDFIYRRPASEWDSPDSKTYNERPWGWDTTAASKPRMLLNLRRDVNNLTVRTRSKRLVEAFVAMNPDDKDGVKEHTPDDSMSAAICNEMRLLRYPNGVAMTKREEQRYEYVQPVGGNGRFATFLGR